ncbi:MAG: hypothetical protein ABIH19_01585, partial [Candidatus Omnitrophota bacterium]
MCKSNLQNLLFNKLASGIILVSFILTSIPAASYAKADKLRPRAATASSALEDLQRDLSEFLANYKIKETITAFPFGNYAK